MNVCTASARTARSCGQIGRSWSYSATQPDEYIGHHIAEFHADPEAIADILRRLAANETLINYEARLRAKDGSIKHVIIHSNALFENGVFVHTRCFTRDITHRMQLEAELLQRADELEVDRRRLQEATEALRLSEEEQRRARADAEAATTAIATLHRIARLLNAAQLDVDTIAQTLIDGATSLVGAC